jgi:hypothetical protein
VRFWEDDNVQYEDPTFAGGANDESLAWARENYRTFGASSRRFLKHVRNPLPDEYPETK